MRKEITPVTPDYFHLSPPAPNPEELQAAMFAIAEKLAEKGKSLFSAVEIGTLVLSVRESGHDVEVVKWAIREHLKAGRMAGQCRQIFPDEDEFGSVEIHDRKTGRTVEMPIFNEEAHVWGTANMWVWRRDSGQEQKLRPQPEEQEPLDAYFSAAQLAEMYGLSRDAPRKRLERWRASNRGSGWMEDTERTSREARYLYRLGAVKPVIDAMRDKTSAPRPTKENSRKHSPNPSVSAPWFPSSSLGTDVCPLVAPNREVPKLELGNQGSSL